MKVNRLAAGILAAGVILSAAGCSRMGSNDVPKEVSEAKESPAGSGQAGGTEAKAENDTQKATRFIVDHTGNEIEIPTEINRVVISSIWPLPSVYCLFEGSADKLVGMHPSSMAAAENSILPKVAPDILKASTGFIQGGDINVEELLNLKPDVVFYSANDRDEYEKLKAAGIPAIGFSTSNWDYDCIATFEGWVNLLGQVLNQEDQAKGIADYGYQVYDEVQNVLNQDKEMEKPKVLILFSYSNGIIKTSGSKFFGQYWIDSTGGVNVAKALSGTPEINMEQIYEWDPDIIYITNFTSYQPEDLINNKIEGNDWSSVKAVKEGKVYKYPLGMYRWFPPASDTPLVLKWMAQKNHPELFADMNMEDEVRTYYKRFYHVDLTDADVEQIFHPAGAAAGSGV